MDREKQIEEMQVDLLQYLAFSENGGVKCGDTAKNLYNAGYRKQSEVAKEIFEEIDERIGFLKNYGYVNFIAQNIFEILDEVKRKYTEESGNDR